MKAPSIRFPVVVRCAALAACAAATHASAEAPAGPRSTSLPEVVVSATRSERSIADVPASVTVISRERIRDTPGDSIDDVIRTVPGLELPIASSYQLHPTSNFPSMLGTKNSITSHVLVMVDGVPLNDAYEGFVQWNRVPKENVERVEVVRGGGATLWGTYALGGVVNIITRTPERNRFSADVGFGSYGTYRADLYGTPVFSDAFKLSLSYNRYSTDGFDQVPPGAATPGYFPRPASAYQKTSFDSDNLQAVANFRIDPSLTGLARLTYHENEQPQFVLVPMSTSQRTWNLDFRLEKAFTPRDKLSFTAFRNQGVFRTNNQSYNDNFTPSCGGGTVYCIASPADQGESFLSNLHHAVANDWGGSLVWQKGFGNMPLSMSLGADVRQIEATEDVQSFTRIFGVPVDVPDPANTGSFGGRQRFLGAFAQLSWFPVDRLEIAPSLRVQRWKNYDGSVLQAVAPNAPGAQPDKDVDDVSARVSARYEVTQEVAVRGALYKAFNAPTLDNLYRTFSANGFTIYSNPNLDPENLYGGEIGLDLQGTAGRMGLTFFQNSIHDYIAFASDANGNFINQNLGKTKAQGLAAYADLAISATLRASFGYTYTRAQVRSSAAHLDWIGEQLAFIPRHKADVALRYGTDRFRADVLARFASKSYGVNGLQFNAIDPTVPLTQSAFPQGMHAIVDVNLAYSSNRRLEVYLRAANLFDRRYVANNDAFAPPLLGTPRTVFAGVRVQLE